MSKSLSSMFLCALAALLGFAVLANVAAAQTSRKRQTSRASKPKKRAAPTSASKAATPPTSPAPTSAAEPKPAPTATEPAAPAADPFALVPRRVEPASSASSATKPSDKPLVYQLRGVVHAVHRQPPVVAIAHETIPGYMEAMTMNFSLKDNSWLEKLKPGDHIEAALFVSQTEGKWWLENIVIKK